MGSQKLIEIAKQGRGAIGRWRKEHPGELLNLSEADLSGLDLRGANLKRADLTGANLTMADLTGAELDGAELTRARLINTQLRSASITAARLFKTALTEAHCCRTRFTSSDLSHADLTRADLTHADFTDATLDHATLAEADLVATLFCRTSLRDVDFRECRLGWTTLASLDLSQSLSLSTARHIGPSALSVDTASRSAAKLPNEFLSGCGLSEGVLQAWKSLFNHPLERARCVIRFTNADASFASQLFQKAQSKGLRCWLDEMPHDPAERKARPSVSDFESDERVLLCASKAALTAWWGHIEIDRALERERVLMEAAGREQRVLFILNLDGFMFSGDWKHKLDKQLSRGAIDCVGWRRNTEKLDQELARVFQALAADRS